MVTRTPSLHPSGTLSLSLAAPAIPDDLLTTDDLARLVGVASKARRPLRGVPSPSVGAADGELPRQDGDADGESHLADGDSPRKNAADAADGDFPNSKIIDRPALAFYVNQNRRLAADVVEGDPLGPALLGSKRDGSDSNRQPSTNSPFSLRTSVQSLPFRSHLRPFPISAKRPDYPRAAIRIATPRENSRRIATLFFRPQFGPPEAPRIAPFPRFLHLTLHPSKRLDAGALLHPVSRHWLSLHPRAYPSFVVINRPAPTAKPQTPNTNPQTR
jgi:hypothetical protein